MIAPPGARPGAVTAAGVLAFAAGGLLIVFHLWTLLALLAYSRRGVAQADSGSFTAMYALLSCRVATGVLYLWGAVAALRGRTRIVLVIAAASHVTFAVLVLITSIVGVHGARAYGVSSMLFVVLDLLVAVPILAFALLPANKDFFAARRSGAR